MSQPSARFFDDHVCPMSTGSVPHVGGPVAGPCEPTVLIGSSPGARISDMAACAGPADVIAQGAASVLIRGLPAARLRDRTAHGGKLVQGCANVVIGGPVFTARPVEQIVSVFGRVVWRYGSSILIEPSSDDPSYQSRALAALIRLDTTPTMHGAFDALEATGHTLTLRRYVPLDEREGPYNASCSAADYSSAFKPGLGSSATIRWDPDIHTIGAPEMTSEAEQPGSDVILAHEAIHGVHIALGTTGHGPTNFGSQNVSEERNTVGLPESTYSRENDPLDGKPLPDTRSLPFTENGVRNDFAERGIPSPFTDRPPIQRPSYYPSRGGGPGSPF